MATVFSTREEAGVAVRCEGGTTLLHSLRCGFSSALIKAKAHMDMASAAAVASSSKEAFDMSMPVKSATCCVAPAPIAPIWHER